MKTILMLNQSYISGENQTCHLKIDFVGTVVIVLISSLIVLMLKLCRYLLNTSNLFLKIRCSEQKHYLEAYFQ